MFSLLPGDRIPASGDIGGNTDDIDVQAALANVLELRLLNSVTRGWNGLPVNGTLGIGNIRAVPLPSSRALLGSGLPALCTMPR